MDSKDIKPHSSVEGHGWVDEDTLDMLMISDKGLKKFVSSCLVDFAGSQLYDYDFTSDDIINFINEECLNVSSSVAASSVYDSTQALIDTLHAIPNYCFNGMFEARTVVYIGRNFQNKDYIIQNARRVIKLFLRQKYPLIEDVKVTIAFDGELWGSSDLHIWMLCGI